MRLRRERPRPVDETLPRYAPNGTVTTLATAHDRYPPDGGAVAARGGWLACTSNVEEHGSYGSDDSVTAIAVAADGRLAVATSRPTYPYAALDDTLERAATAPMAWLPGW